MQIRHVKIENFRGIKKLDWHIPSGFVCLIGSGDSRKSTFLDAIGCALSPMGNVSFDDSDFYDFNESQPISIQVTIGGIEEIDDIARILLSDANYGLYTRGYRSGKIYDEPDEGLEKVLTVEVVVDSDLEPIWQVIAPGRHEPKMVKRIHLESFGVIKLGSYSDNHFTWSKNSLISRLLNSGSSGLNKSLAAIGRKVRNEPLSLEDFEIQAAELEQVVRDFGVRTGKYSPKLDVQALTIRSGGLSLHDGNVPIKRYGTGTKRLVALALQQHLYDGKSIRLIDEIEHGLEPYRIAQLIKKIHIEGGQTIATTHSPVVIREVEAANLTVFHEDQGVIQPVSLCSGLSSNEVSAMQASIRKSAESFLARKIIVCEGPTEVGLVRSYDRYRQSQDKSAFSSIGIAPVDAGGGTNCVALAERLRLAGYQVSILCDSDVPLSKTKSELDAEGVGLMQWTGNKCTEQVIFEDLSDAITLEAVRIAQKYIDISAIKSQLVSEGAVVTSLDINQWSWSSPELRKQLAGASKKHAWYKQIGKAEQLGRAVFSNLTSQDAETDFVKTMDELGEWCDK